MEKELVPLSTSKITDHAVIKENQQLKKKFVKLEGKFEKLNEDEENSNQIWKDSRELGISGPVFLFSGYGTQKWKWYLIWHMQISLNRVEFLKYGMKGGNMPITVTYFCFDVDSAFWEKLPCPLFSAALHVYNVPWLHLKWELGSMSSLRVAYFFTIYLLLVQA